MHADTYVIGNQCLVMYDHNSQVNVYGFNAKAGSKHTCIVNATIAYTKPETGQAIIFLINQAIEMQGLDHHLLYPMQCCMNDVLIDEVPKCLAPVTSETMHAIHTKNPFDTTHPIIIPLNLNGVNSGFKE